MSNYPEWWDSTITVFNKYSEPSTDIVTWSKKTLYNCFYRTTIARVVEGDNIVDTDSVICRIPMDDTYVNPIDWDTNSDLRCEGNFTLQVGDIIVNGEVNDDIDEYSKGKRSTDLIDKYRKYQMAMEIQKVTIDTKSGMINPHYTIRGV